MTSAALTLLETFPGWPDAPDPSFWTIFMICIGAPILVGLVFAVGILGLGRKAELAAETADAGLSLDPEPVDRAALTPTAARRALPADDADVVERTGGATAAR